jgi:hypothetical protein
MAIDPSLLSEAKTAEARVIDAEHAADVARADFHRAVRRLQLHGGSLREIADALGLSHQRVHQIVEAAGGSRRWRKRNGSPSDLLYCSFCGKDQKHVKKLIAGPGVYICDQCVDRADEVLATGTEVATPTATLRAVGEDSTTERCSFCGKARREAAAMASTGGARICNECVALCHEIVTEELA